MRRLLFSFIALTIIIAGCKKDEPATCITVPASQSIAFRLVDSNGVDLLRGGQAGVTVEQPCRGAITLQTDYKTYPVTGSSDTATILGFGNLQTPEYGTGQAECYRILFRFPSGDQDTVDWHYRQDINGECIRQTIDYMSYNGLQAAPETSFGRTYYRLVKRS
jgi:hypothetical protein